MMGQEVISQVRAAMEHDPDINLHTFPIELQLREGALVLAGEVEHISAKRKALRIAREHSGDQPVLDRLLLRTSRHRDGDGLRGAVLDSLTQEPVFHGCALLDEHLPPPDDGSDWIRVTVPQGSSTVRLDGQVNSLSHRRLAEVLTWWTAGTADVDNRLHVQPAEQDTDDELSDAIQLVLDKDPSFDGEQIHVRTRNQEVTLEGAVRSEVNRRLAAQDCWYVAGVHAVHNRLEVRP
ncbi:BON domain-containing protein [Alkalilimnicola sp. S0819]|uniref:BON domain-containing protein n=1 Tax=Alkalilimnicola sp. S0819 TaxID=2613922 RepID=UPI0018697B3C|nr:BON domain-containing protein [Alkalilimnicola sp. S0819]